MKKCTYCGKEYSDETSECTIDGQLLTPVKRPLVENIEDAKKDAASEPPSKSLEQADLAAAEHKLSGEEDEASPVELSIDPRGHLIFPEPSVSSTSPDPSGDALAKVRLGPLVLAFLLCASAVGAFSYAQHVMNRTEEIINSRDGVAFLNAEKALEFYKVLTTPDENGRAFYDFVPKYKELQRKVEENKRTKGTMNVLGCVFAAGAGLNAYLAFRRKPPAYIEPV